MFKIKNELLFKKACAILSTQLSKKSSSQFLEISIIKVRNIPVRLIYEFVSVTLSAIFSLGLDLMPIIMFTVKKY